MQDDQLLAQYARTGSDAAFSQLVARHLPLVYRTCRRELGSDTLAEDAAQVVFLLLACKAKTFRASPSLAGWLFQTAVFVARDVRKQEARRRRREKAVMQEAIHQQPHLSPEWDSIEPLLNNALAALRPADRDAVLLRFFEGHTLAEIGALLGLSEDAARMRCARAVEKMRLYLTAHRAAVTGLTFAGFLTAEAVRPVPAHAAIITQGTLQAIYSGPTANILLLSKGVTNIMKIIKVKVTALAVTTLLLGASLPLAHAFSYHRKSAQAAAAPATAPQQAGLSWLALTDSGKNAQAWKAASPTFQSLVTQSQWAQEVQSARAPLGKFQKRTLQSGQRTATLPGVPPGDYAVLTYSTVFEKKAAIETVVLTHNTDGKWRVSGYFIK